MSESEIRSRYEITLENYCKTVTIEAMTMIDMTRKLILPAIEAYSASVAESLGAKLGVVPELSGKYEKEKLAPTLSSLEDSIDASVSALESSLIRLRAIDDVTDSAFVFRDVILQKMAELRVTCDEAETLTAKKYSALPHLRRSALRSQISPGKKQTRISASACRARGCAGFRYRRK